MKTSGMGLGVLCAIAGIYMACSAGGGSTFNGSDDDGGTTGAAGSTGSFNPSGSGGGDAVCNSAATEDHDQDGFTRNAGDCNDCDVNVNPGAVEVPTDAMDPEAKEADENCDGMIDEPATVCDTNTDLSSTDGVLAAGAIDLCKQAGASDWGILSAEFVRANGTPAAPGVQVGILDAFGSAVPPRAGSRMLALSSGHARAPNHPNPCNDYSCYTSGPGTPPPGFPQDVPSCSGATDINDDVALQVQMRAPTNATGYSFDFTFYSFEYPEWVCTSFNDQFIALVDPAPMGAINGNISFDSMTNPVSVNIAFFQVCSGCPLGTQELAGTGFDVWDDAGATGWLVTQAPVEPGEEFSIRFAIWDTGDQAWDSTVLIDNFQWIANAGTVTVGTEPVK
jgi:hypothetical protein